ncbi:MULTISPECIES: nicotinate phosphoribosyltransferase [Idiomarina]|uniref:nicotinate phosphoribosyltransferase n=1 Tax=Idiomarina TaxID=135575 RepID=UPI00258E172D|nr:nicotinate phosphoribosyltransferase [Idiomarina sp.]
MTGTERQDLGLFTDLYQLTMLDAYLQEGMQDDAVFTLFVRRLPNERKFLLAAGLDPLLETIENLSFSDDDLRYLKEQNFSQQLIDYLRDFEFIGQVRALPEGTVFFENEPIVEIKAPLPQAQLIETLVMNQIHLQTLLASKGARVAHAAEKRPVLDFGARRVHGIDAGKKGSRALYLSGIAATSNMLAARTYGLPVAGTMAHSYIQAHDSEYQALKNFTQVFPETVLLVDTIDTLKGVEKVIQLANELGDDFKVKGIRLDSGDLGDLAVKARKLLDEHNLHHLEIIASGGLDEHKIAQLIADKAPIDGFGVGTGMGVSDDAAALDMAYKLVEYAGKGRLKLSSGKPVLPGEKQVFRESGDNFRRDTIARAEEQLPGEPLLKKVMQSGKRLPSHQRDIEEIRQYAQQQLNKLPEYVSSISSKEKSYPVEISDKLASYQKEITEHLKQEG